MKDTIHKLWSAYRRTMIAVVKPLVALWLIVEGVPPAVRALCNGANSIVKTFMSSEKVGRSK